MAYIRGSRSIDSREKSMSSYALHAWRDAMAIAVLLDQEVGIARARKLYEGVDKIDVMAYEMAAAKLIAEFIGKTEGQRISFVNKWLPDSEKTRVVFLTLAIIGCMRAKGILEMRDIYRYSLAPGGGNRVTVSGVYAFGQEVTEALISYEWPCEPIEELGLDAGRDEDSEP